MGIFSEIDVEQESRDELQHETTEQPQISLVESPPPAESDSEAEPAETQLVADSQDKDAAPAEDKDEETKRKEHEAAEAKRKAEWEARQQKKKAAMQEKLDHLAAMSDDEVMVASMKQVSADTEKLTRRNMKDCVSEHIQTLCLDNPAFARKVMHPGKSMVHCIWYINRKAKEFVEQEMKDNDIKPENGIYGSDVPDDLCYQWAVDYFNDPDAEEDKEKDEQFVPKPYIGKSAKSKGNAKKAGTKKTEKKGIDKPKSESQPTGDDGQLSLLGVA
ncbi:MAG: hypothetical protein HFF38_12370 [Lawsonibacter sp.]|nr:hypothetical protein [Lawsonibacter sp.]